ncbi:MAG: YqcC family protein [Oceanospirillaceae bacterium]|nr:YqcC family protein [Oceanospirillaceae bacterium]MCP5335409.1 YqcC family protein [Oceanospirillaceae bacterium]MCP5351420.1 YqcC family protein [Oceanospirillaceae bacterium]
MDNKNNFRKQSEKDKKVLLALDEIEAEMKKIGFWSDNPPLINVDNYLKAHTFELWLQCVFLENAREATLTGKYPNASQVGIMAMREYDYHSCIEEALNLVKLLHGFDKLVTGK